MRWLTNLFTKNVRELEADELDSIALTLVSNYHNDLKLILKNKVYKIEKVGKYNYLIYTRNVNILVYVGDYTGTLK